MRSNESNDIPFRHRSSESARYLRSALHYFRPARHAALGGIVRALCGVRTHGAVLLLGLLLTSCGPRRVVVGSQKTDSVRMVREVEYVERLRDTIVYVALPAESRETFRCDSSLLETSLAVSFARVEPGGTLYHTLVNKPSPLPVSVQTKETGVREVERATVISHERVEVPVRLPLTRWQRFLLWSGVAAWVVLAVVIILKLIRR